MHQTIFIKVRKGKFVMRCNKCGAQCDDNQAFCLMCGSPLQISTDFNEIELELASSIDELMNELESDTVAEEEAEQEELLKTIDVPIEEINMGLKVVDIKRQHDTSIDLMLEEDEEDIEPILMPTERPVRRQPREDREPVSNKKKAPAKKNKKNSNAKLYGIVGAVCAVIAILAVGLILVLGGAGKKEEPKTFEAVYAEAQSKYNAGDKAKALELAIEARDIVDAANGADEVKARKLIHKIYVDLNYSGKVFLDNIKVLMELGDTSEDYYASLFSKYISDANTDMLRELIDTVGIEQAKTYMGEAFVEGPTSTVESGQHKNVVATELKAGIGCKIFYVINGDIDSTSEEYTKVIEILTPGEYKLEAYAVDANGIPSAVVTYNYSIVKGDAAAPVVTPSAGTYSEDTFITITVPEGGKAYYTYDGTEPTTSSTEYTEPVAMLNGNNVFKAIVVDKYGIVSEVTSKTYILKLKRNETPKSGEDKVWGTLEQAGTVDKDGYTVTGTKIDVSYENAVEIEGREYYIYVIVETSEDGTSTSTLSYSAVDTHSGVVIEGVLVAGDSYILPEEEVDDETTTE